MTTVRIPGGIDGATVRGPLLRDHDIETGGGGKAWRTGLMGDSARDRNVLALLSAPEATFNASSYEAAYGSSLAAAQRSLAAFADSIAGRD